MLSNELARPGFLADRMIAVTAERRDQGTLSEYNLAMTALINATEKLWAAAAYIGNQNDTILTRYSRIKRLSWGLREIAGLERSVIASAIATGKQIPPEDIRQIENGRAQIQFGWHLLRELTLFEEDSVPIKRAIAEAEQKYFGTFQPLINQMRKLNEEHTAHTISLSEWIAQTNPYIDFFLKITSRHDCSRGTLRSARIRRIYLFHS